METTSKNKRSQKGKALAKPSKPIALAPNRVATFHMMVMSHMANLVGGEGQPGEVAGRFRALKDANPSAYNTARGLFRNMSQELFGTWMPRIMFHGAVVTNVVSTAGGLIVVTQRLRANELAYFSSFAGIFDEFRFFGPIAAYYRPENVPSSGGLNVAYAVGVIDLDNGNALSSLGGALMYDTAKIFCLHATHVVKPTEQSHTCAWETKLLGIPDLTWGDTSGGSTDVAWWKAYAYSNVPISTTFGVVAWRAGIEFRQLYGI